MKAYYCISFLHRGPSRIMKRLDIYRLQAASASPYWINSSPTSFYSLRSFSDSLSMQNKSIMKKLYSCKQSREVSEVIRTNPLAFQNPTLFQHLLHKVAEFQHHNLRPKEISGLTNSLSKLSATSEEGRELHRTILFELSESAKRQIRYFQVKDLSMLLNSLARSHIQNDLLFQEAAKTVLFKIEAFNSQDLANTANAFAKLKYSNPRVFNTVAKAAISQITLFRPQGLSNIVNAFAKMNHVHPDLFDEVAKAAIFHISKDRNSFTAQGLSNVMNAYAKNGHYHPDLFEAVAYAAIPRIRTFNAQNLANTANAYAKMNHFHQDIFDAISERALGIISKFKPQELSNLVNAFAKLNYDDHPGVFDEVARAALPILNRFKAQELASLVNACAKMNHYYPRLWNETAQYAILNLSAFNAQELASLSNAFSKMGHRHDELFQNVAKESLSIMDTFEAQNVANLVNSFAKMDHTNVALFESAARKAIRILGTFNPQELANLVSAFARIRADGDSVDRLFQDVSLRMKSEASSLSTWDDRNLVEVAYAFLKGYQTDPHLLDLIGTEIISRPVSTLDALGLGNLAAAFSRHETASSTAVLTMIFEKFQTLPKEEIELQNIADIAKMLWLGDKLKVMPLGFPEQIAALAIEKAEQAQPADVRDLVLNLASPRLPLDDTKRQKFLVVYKPIFESLSSGIAEKHQQTIHELYEAFKI